jgi:flagellar basal-body rod protein FlgF
MDNVGYTTLSRQSGLLRELQMLANNVANVSTAGFRREGLVFSEHIEALGRDEESLSMANPLVRAIDLTQGTLTPTGGALDLGIEGDGFFQVETPQGPMLTRAGAFATNEAGEIVTPDGRRLLDVGGAPIFVPPGAADVSVARDGTVSAGGQPVGQVALVVPADVTTLARDPSGLFTAAEVRPAGQAVILQGFVEASNVNPIVEIARLIEVQHAYEQGAKFLEQDHQRIRDLIQTLGR